MPQIASNIDVLMISPYRLDRNSNEGGILGYFKNNIMTKSLKTINLSSLLGLVPSSPYDPIIHYDMLYLFL